MKIRVTVLIAALLLLIMPLSGSVLGQEEGNKKELTQKELDKAVVDAIKKAAEKVAEKMSEPGYWDAFFKKTKNVAVKMPIIKERPIRWQLLGEKKYIRDMRFIGKDRLLVSYQFGNPILVDTSKGKILWRFIPDGWLTSGTDIVMAFEDVILVRNDDDKEMKVNVAAIDAVKGKQLWVQFFEKKKKSFDLVPVLSDSVLLVIEREKKKATVKGYDLFKGDFLWEKPYKIKPRDGHPPRPLITVNGVWNFIMGTEKFSAKTGKPEWVRRDIVLDGKSPEPQMSGDQLMLIDSGGILHILDANTGKTVSSSAVDPSIRYTNIYPLGDRIYLRGAIEAKKKPETFIMESISRKNGNVIWKYQSKDPVVSNIIRAKSRLYFSTPFNLISVNRDSGRVFFNSPASQTGRTFPVQVRKYGNTVVYIGELIIAGFDAGSGKRLYRHGMTPLTQEVYLDALDSFIGRLQERIGRLTRGIWFTSRSGSGNYFNSQARISQNLSNRYYSQANITYGRAASWSSRTGGRLYGSSDYWQSQKLYSQAQVESAYSGAFAQLGFFFTMKELGDTMRLNAVKDDQGELKKLEFIRRSLYSAYLAAKEGEYIYRPHLESGSTGIIIIHLPSGKMAFTPLSPDSTKYGKLVNWNSRGLWNLVDFGRKLVYYHGLRISDDKYQDKKMPENERNYGVYLLAQPIKIPE